MPIVNFGNAKGGVGKTTLTVNVALCLAELGKKVLIIDLDGQEDIEKMIGGDPSFKDKFSSDKLFKINPKPICFPVTTLVCRQKDLEKYLFYIPSKYIEMGKINSSEKMSLATNFTKNVRELEKEYDYVFLDCPPSLGMSQLSALHASDFSVMPLITDIQLCGQSKVDQYIEMYRMVRKRNPKLKVPIFVINNVDYKSSAVKPYIEWATSYLGSSLLSNVIPHGTYIRNSRDAMKAVWYKNTSGSDSANGTAYRRTMLSLIKRLQNTKGK